MAKKKEQSGKNTPRIRNRKATHDYHLIEKLECGIELTGTEVKSLRAGQGKIDEAYARIQDGELYLIGANIAHYKQASEGMQHDPTRKRRLLAHKRQIAQLESYVRQKGKTIVPLAIYFKNGWAKCEVAVGEGKRSYDKREDIRKRDMQRDIKRAMRRRR
ncbi:MAG: SsrA-binding protein SmpB [Phycisphaerae bacterium]